MDEARAKFLEGLENTALEWQPFQHFYIQDVFPKEYYEQLLKELPPDESYTDRTYENRMMVSVKDLNYFWQDVGKWLFNVSWEVIDKFEATIRKRNAQRFSADVRLVRDKTGYKIKPHTDIKSKAVSLLFYLAKDDSDKEAGTSLMVPNDPTFTSDGTKRYEFDDFKIVYTAPFLPNSVIGFPRSDTSFHGVKPTSAKVRDVMLLNVYAMFK